MTNYERIKGMSVEEMAELLAAEDGCETFCAFVKDGRCDSYGGDKPCNKGIELWLNSEVEE